MTDLTSDLVQFHGWKKRISIFISGQMISLFGSSLVQFVIIWYITLTTVSGMMMTIATLCGFVPQIILGLFSGVWADRFNRKNIIILADSMIALSTLMVSLLFIFGYREIWLLFLVLAFRSLGGGIQMPAISALIPQLVPTDKLMKVNGIVSSMQALILLLSPAIGGVILTLAPIEIALFVDLITAIIGIGFLLLITVPTLIKSEAKVSSYLKDLIEGVKYVASHRLVRSIIIFYGIFFFAVTPAALLSPLLIARNFGTEVWRLTLNEVLFSAGAILGGIIIASWGGFKNRLLTIAIGCTIIGVLNIVLGMGYGFIAFLILIFLMGIIVPVISTPTSVLLQEKVEKEIQGRVFGLYGIITSAAFPIGIILFGPLADIVKIETLLIITGIFITLSGFAIIINKPLMKLGYSNIQNVAESEQEDTNGRIKQQSNTAD